jgi:hypothetical protein
MVPQKLWPLPVGSLLFAGRSSVRQLERLACLAPRHQIVHLCLDGVRITRFELDLRAEDDALARGKHAVAIRKIQLRRC